MYQYKTCGSRYIPPLLPAFHNVFQRKLDLQELGTSPNRSSHFIYTRREHRFVRITRETFFSSLLFPTNNEVFVNRVLSCRNNFSAFSRNNYDRRASKSETFEPLKCKFHVESQTERLLRRRRSYRPFMELISRTDPIQTAL